MNNVKLHRSMRCLVLGVLVFLILPLPVIAKGEVTASFTVGLVISNMAASATNWQGCTVSWETNDNAASQVFCDKQFHDNVADYAKSSTDTNLVTQHSVQVSSLLPNTAYHYRAKSVATVGGIDFVAVSDDYTFQTTTVPVYAPSNSFSGNTFIVRLVGLTSPVIVTVNSAGIVQTSVQITTSDGRILLTIPAGTQLLFAKGQLSNLLSANIITPLPSSSQNQTMLMCDFGSIGVTFTPPITLTINYDTATLPSGVLESTLYIAYWFGSQWQAMPSTIDSQTGTISTQLSHFSLIALRGKSTTLALAPTPMTTLAPVATPASAPAPALETTALTPTSAPEVIPAPLLLQTPQPFSPLERVFNWWLVGAGSIVAGVIIIGVSWFLRARRRAVK